MLEDARRIGIPAFSHLARNAFAAVSLLRSLASAGVMGSDDVDRFLGSVRTVPSAMQDDALRVDRGETSWEDFVATYGHLRPGSYDITSPCYASAPMEFLGPMLDGSEADRRPAAGEPWSSDVRASIDAALAESGLGVGVDAFERFLRAAVEGREFAKFCFTRNLGAALEALADFGAALGVGREELAHVRIASLFALRGAQPAEAASALPALAREGREEAAVAQAVCLPALLLSEEDLSGYEQRAAVANFIGGRRACADAVCISGTISPSVGLAGKIVLIVNADPGYDWLFSRDIAGLVTMYGGVNSHMAIRAGEFQLPAAIGVGELLFERLRRARTIDLDCGSRQIRVVG
jgi:hypothetical protein